MVVHRKTMTEQLVRRAIHDRDNPYMMLMRDAAQDERLSYESRGLLSFILSKPKDWVIKVSGLQTKRAGRDKVRGMLRELAEFGYATLPVRIQSPDGTWGWTAYEIYEDPSYNELFQPKTEKPNSVNTSSYKIQEEQNKEEKIKEKDSSTFSENPVSGTAVSVISESSPASSKAPLIETFPTVERSSALKERAPEKDKRVSHIAGMIVKLGGAYLNRSQRSKLSNPIFITTQKKGKRNAPTASEEYDAPDKLYESSMMFRQFVSKRLKNAVKSDEELTPYAITGRMVRLVCEYGAKGGWLEYLKEHDNSDVGYVEGTEL